MTDRFAPTDLKPPYYAVIFSNQIRDDFQSSLYEQTATKMIELAQQQPGYLGIESSRDESGFGITVSYWKDLASIKLWREQSDQKAAQKIGLETFYSTFSLRISKVESDRQWNND